VNVNTPTWSLHDKWASHIMFHTANPPTHKQTLYTELSTFHLKSTATRYVTLSVIRAAMTVHRPGQIQKCGHTMAYICLADSRFSYLPILNS